LLDRYPDMCKSTCMNGIYILGLVVVAYLLGSIRVLRQYERGVVFLLGKFAGARGAGLTLVFVPIQQMMRVSLRMYRVEMLSQLCVPRASASHRSLVVSRRLPSPMGMRFVGRSRSDGRE
jgi:hypothetical protein